MARENGAKAQPRYYIQILCLLSYVQCLKLMLFPSLNINIENENPSGFSRMETEVRKIR